MKGNKKEKKLLSLRGCFRHRINEQNRVSLPSNFREALKNRGVKRLVVAKYADCLRAFPEDVFEERESRLSGLDLDDDKAIGYLRQLYSNLSEVEVDMQGRIILSEDWRREFSIKDQVLLLGLGSVFEVWNPDYFQYKERELKEQFGANRAHVSEVLEKRKRDEGT